MVEGDRERGRFTTDDRRRNAKIRELKLNAFRQERKGKSQRCERP